MAWGGLGKNVLCIMIYALCMNRVLVLTEQYTNKKIGLEINLILSSCLDTEDTEAIRERGAILLPSL